MHFLVNKLLQRDTRYSSREKNHTRTITNPVLLHSNHQNVSSLAHSTTQSSTVIHILHQIALSNNNQTSIPHDN